jgi:hypothetical protein
MHDIAACRHPVIRPRVTTYYTVQFPGVDLNMASPAPSCAIELSLEFIPKIFG